MFRDHLNWVPRRLDQDFGVDLEAELAEVDGRKQQLTGKLLKIQIKSTEKLERKNSHVVFQIERDLLHYADAFRLPMILAVTCLEIKTVWWLWLQEWTMLNEERLALNPNGRTIAVHIPLEQTLTNDLNRALPAIARGVPLNAKIIALRAIVEAASDWESPELSAGVTELLAKVHGPSRGWTLQKVIDRLIGFGATPHFGTTQQVLPVLMPLIDSAGDSFTADQVLRLVGRGETYSRTGLLGLSRLFDVWPDHVYSLKLVTAFEAANLGHIAWYCAMRERYPTKKDDWFGFGITHMKDVDLGYGGYRLKIDDETRDYIVAKWPNRGDNVLIDCLTLDK